NVGTVTAFNQTTDKIGSGSAPLNPRLTALGTFGGRTPTHLIGLNSLALNAGSNTGAPATDQRGVTRPIGGTVDIGAVEAQVSVSPSSIPSGTANSAYSSTTFTA